MDFIERLFSISPDGGSGILELALFAIPFCGIVALVTVRQMQRRILSP